jgi:hypothetical protein
MPPIGFGGKDECERVEALVEGPNEMSGLRMEWLLVEVVAREKGPGASSEMW